MTTGRITGVILFSSNFFCCACSGVMKFSFAGLRRSSFTRNSAIIRLGKIFNTICYNTAGVDHQHKRHQFDLERIQNVERTVTDLVVSELLLISSLVVVLRSRGIRASLIAVVGGGEGRRRSNCTGGNTAVS